MTHTHSTEYMQVWKWLSLWAIDRQPYQNSIIVRMCCSAVLRTKAQSYLLQENHQLVQASRSNALSSHQVYQLYIFWTQTSFPFGRSFSNFKSSMAGSSRVVALPTLNDCQMWFCVSISTRSNGRLIKGKLVLTCTKDNLLAWKL